MRHSTRTVLCIALILCLVFPAVVAVDAKTWYDQGMEFFGKGEYAAAIDAYKNAVSADPTYLDAWIALGYADVKAMKLDDAVDAYQHALAIEPNNTIVLKGLSYVYTRQGKDQNALDVIQKAVAINPADSSAWLQMGLTLSALGRVNESIPAYQKVLVLSPGNFDAYLCMGQDYYLSGNYTAAHDAFSHALEADDRSGIAWRYQGDTLSHLGRYQEAIEAYNRGLIVDPGNADLIQGRDTAQANLRSYIEGNTTSATGSSSPFRGVPLLIGIIVVVAVAGIVVYRKRVAGKARGGTIVPPSPDSGPRRPIGEAAGHHDVFISYSSRDKAVADATCAYLESRNIRCWIAPRDVLPGANFPRSIVEAIDESSIMVLVFSSHSNSSPHVVRELTHAVSKGVIILPFRIEDIQPSKDMEYLIGIPHWLDAMTPPLDRHLTHLADTVEILLRTTKEPGQDKPV